MTPADSRRGRRKSEIAVTKPEILISQELFGHRAVELLDPENMGVAVGISSLSRKKVEMYVISYLCPVIGRHFWFSFYPDVGQYSQ